MIDKFCGITPKTWALVQDLLDANGDARWQAKPPKEVANYQKRHDPNIDLDPFEVDDEGVKQDMSESESKSESGSRGKGKDSSSQVKRRNAALLRVVSEE